jgi:HD-GYP domain-containing protein (c-di-GMP phosphodiesterase class II)
VELQMHPLQLSQGLIQALRDGDEVRTLGNALATELRQGLDALGVSVHELEGDRLDTIGRSGNVHPELGSRARAAAAGGRLAGGFGFAVAGQPATVVVCDRQRPPAPMEMALVQSGCELFAVASARLRRERVLRAQAQTGRALVELGETLSLDHGEDHVLHLLTLSVARLIDHRGVAAWRSDPDGLTLIAAAGYVPRLGMAPGRHAGWTPFLREVTSSRRVREAQAGQAPGLIGGDRATLVPIGERGANRALLVVEQTIDAAAGQEALLLGVADQALLAIENDRLLDGERRALDGVVACLGRALAVRHRGTAEHSDRLVGDCEAVARRLGLSGDEVRDVTFAAALHDLGKIGVPERVLDNRGELSEADWKPIRAHPEMGAQIIDAVPALAGAATLVRACHEHWDGSGYPRGLAGEEIPLGARIVFACDAYHAMCEDRPYQAAMSQSEAISRLVELRGVHFDPQVVDALVDHLAAQNGAAPRPRTGVSPA